VVLFSGCVFNNNKNLETHALRDTIIYRDINTATNTANNQNTTTKPIIAPIVNNTYSNNDNNTSSDSNNIIEESKTDNNSETNTEENNNTDPAPAKTTSFYENFSDYDATDCLSNDFILNVWISEYINGAGCNQIRNDKQNKWLSVESAITYSHDTTKSALILGPYFDGNVAFEIKINTKEQLREDSPKNPDEVGWILWNYTDAENFYYFIPKTNGWELGKIHQGNKTVLADGTNHVFAINKWYNIKIIQTENNITIYVDNILIADTDTQGTFTSGKIGVYAKDSTVFVDNIRVNFSYTNAYFEKFAKETVEYILNCQRDTGAILQTPSGTVIMPYFANLALINLADYAPDKSAEIKKYIEWYLSKYNQTSDNLGVAGTIYDFTVNAEGNEVPTFTVNPDAKNYDSSDSYAATFLSLIKRYYDITHDTDFINANLIHFKKIASAIDATLQNNNLTWAKPDYKTQYLMDNSEVYQGYRDFAILLDEIGDVNAKDYSEKADAVKEAIETLLWNNERQEYLPYYEKGYITNWDVFYPDASANLWPSLYEVNTNTERTAMLFSKLIETNPDWVTLTAGSFPWVSLGIISAELNDPITYIYIENLENKYFERKWPWYVAQAGWYLRLLNNIS